MNKKLLILISIVLCILLCSCSAELGEPDMTRSVQTEANTVSITFINYVEEADIWILPQTEENLKTSLWGTPTFSKMKAGEEGTPAVTDEGTGRYIIRIIDTDHAYYSANDLVLDDNYTVHFKTDDSKYEAGIIILDENGDSSTTVENVFQGVLGAN